MRNYEEMFQYVGAAGVISEELYNAFYGEEE